MHIEGVAIIPRCAECEAHWLPADDDRWHAHLGGDDLEEPAEVVFYCPDCAEREFGDQPSKQCR
jgi:predicted RNA-binding Zn-ribbon protein involved in translation (DUF1610 family)